MKVIDISVTISSDTPVYPGDPKPVIEKVCSIEDDDFCVSRIVLGSHTGTHIDAPSHVMEGARAIDRLPLEEVVGRAVLLDLSAKRDIITGADLSQAYGPFFDWEDAHILLIKTSNSGVWRGIKSPVDQISMDESAAEWIVENGFRTAGVDGFSVEGNCGTRVHRILLEKGINIIECLDLTDARQGIYMFVCLPLKIKDCDAAPARAILLETPELF